MAKFTPAYLKKLETLLEDCGYDVRYEKGNFKSNYCILEDKKIVVINKFSVLESKVQSLLEIIQSLYGRQLIKADLRSIGLKNPIQTTGTLDFQNEAMAQDSQVGEEGAPDTEQEQEQTAPV